jgi:hypothetical protein
MTIVHIIVFFTVATLEIGLFFHDLLRVKNWCYPHDLPHTPLELGLLKFAPIMNIFRFLKKDSRIMKFSNHFRYLSEVCMTNKASLRKEIKFELNDPRDLSLTKPPMPSNKTCLTCEKNFLELDRVTHFEVTVVFDITLNFHFSVSFLLYSYICS